MVHDADSLFCVPPPRLRRLEWGRMSPGRRGLGGGVNSKCFITYSATTILASIDVQPGDDPLMSLCPYFVCASATHPILLSHHLLSFDYAKLSHPLPLFSALCTLYSELSLFGGSLSFNRCTGDDCQSGGLLPCCRCNCANPAALPGLPAAQICTPAPPSRTPARQFGGCFAIRTILSTLHSFPAFRSRVSAENHPKNAHSATNTGKCCHTPPPLQQQAEVIAPLLQQLRSISAQSRFVVQCV
jgi:hypothetical protein